jgi:prolyl oligopeptidase PreP (S9A serine peptidase family)
MRASSRRAAVGERVGCTGVATVEQNAGHGGADVIKQQVDAWADRLAFLTQQLGLDPERH